LSATCDDCQREYRARERENAAVMRMARQSDTSRGEPLWRLGHDAASLSRGGRVWLGVLVASLGVIVVGLALYILLTYSTVKRGTIVVYAVAAPVAALITLLLYVQVATSSDRRGGS
jgi:hypothetical protein